ncbi:poly [ADP-ribose] polymerase 14 [Biomphalaria glabrata]|nr:poly [ADP-ribose] polymerase 14 [Biomphalaria glabrata]
MFQIKRDMIYYHHADVTTLPASLCVSTIHISKNLRNGRLSSSILHKAGAGIQTEINAKSTETLQRCHRIVTSPGDLKHKFSQLMFVCLTSWEDDCKEDLYQVVYDSLKHASRETYDTVALPALGMGGLSYPPYEVAMAMLRAIGRFFADTPMTTVKNIHISVHGVNEAILRSFARSSILFSNLCNDKLAEFSYANWFFDVIDNETVSRLKENQTAPALPSGLMFQVEVRLHPIITHLDKAFQNAYNEVMVQTLKERNKQGRDCAIS